MTPKDDDIPDLFSETARVPSERRVEKAPSPAAARPRSSVVPEARSSVIPEARASVPPPASPGTGTGLSLDWKTDEPATPEATSDDGDGFEFDLLAATSGRGDDFGFAPAAPVARKVTPPPTTLASPHVAPSARAASAVASPAVAASRGSVAPPAASTRAVSQRPAPLIDVDPTAIEDLPLSTRASSPELLAVPSQKRSSYPPPMSAAAASVNTAIPGNAALPGNLPSGLEGGNVLDWDLDEALGLAPAADLVVATTVPTKSDDDGPWPEARTPDPTEHSIPFDEAQKLAAFGPSPSGMFSTPLYFVRVLAGRDRVRALVREAERQLTLVETKRDARVAELGESLRASLEGQERFVELYSQIARYDELIQARERDLGTVDQQGANYFAEHERKLDEAKKATAAAAAVVVERRLIAEEAARAVSRARALVSRFEIEKRNVEELAQKRPTEGGFMPPDLAARYQYLEKDLTDARQKLSASESEQKSQRQLLRQVEDLHREATATEQRFEGEREGFLMSHEGALSDHASLLDEARRGRSGQMTHAGRVVLELRGEVKVARDVREEIHALDQEVKAASRRAELSRRAAGTLDARAFAQGRTFWIALGVAFVLFLLWGILR